MGITPSQICKRGSVGVVLLSGFAETPSDMATTLLKIWGK